MMSPQVRRLAAECFGTFALVFAGTGAIVINDISGGIVSHLGIALTFGLVVLAMICAIGDVSGCHLNPAVTLGFFVARRFEGSMVAPYVASQTVGAMLASCTLRLMFPGHSTLGSTFPAGNPMQSLVLEVILTALLMFVILSVSTGSQERGLLVGITVGAVVALEAIFGGPISGASMNPARSLAPALVAGRFEHLWVYLIAPLVGALSGTGLCLVIHGPGECCHLRTKGWVMKEQLR